MDWMNDLWAPVPEEEVRTLKVAEMAQRFWAACVLAAGLDLAYMEACALNRERYGYK